MIDRRMAGVLGMIHERDALDQICCNRAGIIGPSRRLPKTAGFVRAALRIANSSAPIVDADGLGHANTDQTKGRFAECSRFLLGFEAKIDDEHPAKFSLRNIL